MKTIKRFIFVLTAIAAHLSLAQQTITISPLDKNRIQIEYQFPKSCSETSLLGTYEGRAPSLRKDWQALDKCSHLIDGEKLMLPKNCHSSHFAIPMSTAFVDRVEPYAYPMDDLGVRVHTGTFSLTDKCGATTWIFKSPKGSVVDESGIYTQRFKAYEAEKKYLVYTGVYLSYLPIPANTQQIFTKTVPPELTKTITEGQQLLGDYYKKTYPSIPFTSAFLLIDNIPDRNGFGNQAEVTSPHMIRIGYRGWTPSKTADTQHLQAHEYAHLLQLNKNKPRSPLFNEGGAEFISLMATYHLGWINIQSFSNKISSAIQSCLNLSEEKTWDDIKNAFGRIPYDCGLVMHTLALASRQQPDSAEHSLELYYQSQADDTNFARAIECGSYNDCTPTFIPEFTGNKKSIASVITEALNRLKLVTQTSYSSPLDHDDAAIRTAFSSLMMEDCNGADFYTQKNNFLTGEMLSCKHIPKQRTITTVNGINYFMNPEAAIDSQNQSCTTSHTVVLSNDKNVSQEMPCSKVVQKNYYSIHVDKLLALLDKKTLP